MKAIGKAEREATKQYAIDTLKEWLKGRETASIATLLVPGARSSTRDYVRVFIARDGRVQEITAVVAKAIVRRFDPDKGIVVDGGGFDKGDDIVEAIAVAVWGSPEAFRCVKGPFRHDRL